MTTKPAAAELGKGQLLDLFRFMKLNRMLEEKLTNLYRQGKVVGGLYRSLGQEACSVGSAYALEAGDIFTPLIRDLGAIFVRGGKPRDVLAQYMAKASGPTRGRDLNTHFGWLSEEGSMPAVISMLGDMIPILVGAVIAERMKGKKTVALNWIGDGGVSTGAFHEGLNLACVQKAPFVLIVENNKYAYSTPTRKQTANPRFVDRAQAYGCHGEQVDGNDVLAVYEVTRLAIGRARSGEGPTLIEANTMRMRGHAEHDDMKYVPADLLDAWAKRDPITRYERRLLDSNRATQKELDEVVAAIEAQLAEDLAWAEASPFPAPDSGLDGVYGDRPVAAPTPPLVLEWERRRKVD
ncbi:MAG TPA: thiamine pyrophosphate-dependent dehydrogenase E1 component subunit alpha [Vicinamibacteria bacterium]|nr:thiamine pyrophosphate-dependent dehydrogenase E1 component subunit alpha [Vicinamibacteria bacterium]